MICSCTRKGTSINFTLLLVSEVGYWYQKWDIGTRIGILVSEVGHWYQKWDTGVRNGTGVRSGTLVSEVELVLEVGH